MIALFFNGPENAMRYTPTFLLLLPTLGAIHLAHAEQTSTDDVLELEPVTVSVRGFDEDNLQTPFMVTTISADEVDNGKLNTLEDALRSDPSSGIHNGGNVAYSSLWMRGSGSLSITSLDDNSVDFRVDGVSNGKTGLIRNLIDVEKIEIAKGPQGTLLGSKSEAGVYALKTYDPMDYFDARLGLGVGNKGQREASFMINAPLFDNVALRLAGVVGQKDSDMIKKENGEPLNTNEKQGIQAKLGWHDDAYQHRVVLGVYYDRQTDHVPVVQRDFSNFEVTTFNMKHNSENIAKGVTLNVQSELGFADLSAITGLHVYTGDIARPFMAPEVLPLTYQRFGIPAAMQPTLNAIFAKEENNRQRLLDDYQQISQELTLASKADSDIKWLTGIYLEARERTLKNDAKIELSELPASNQVKQLLTATAGNGDLKKTAKTSSQAIFGELTYPILERLDAIVGARISHDRLDHSEHWVGNKNNPYTAAGEKQATFTDSETAYTGRVGLSFAIQPTWRIYALQSRGHKFGAVDDYNTNIFYNNPITPYKSTTIDASELGTKIESDDGNAYLRMALYHNTMHDARVKIGGLPPAYETKSANVDAKSYGLDLDARLRVFDHWTLGSGLALMKTEVTRAPAQAVAQKITKVGYDMPQSPEVSAYVDIQYNHGISFLSDGQWFAGINQRYVGSRFAEANNLQTLDEYSLLSARLGVANQHHSLSVWGKNLADTNYLNIGVNPGNVGIRGPSRSFGVQYGYQW